MSFMSQNFCLLHVSNLSVLNFRICLLMYPGSLAVACGDRAGQGWTGLGGTHYKGERSKDRGKGRREAAEQRRLRDLIAWLRNEM